VAKPLCRAGDLGDLAAQDIVVHLLGPWAQQASPWLVCSVVCGSCRQWRVWAQFMPLPGAAAAPDIWGVWTRPHRKRFGRHYVPPPVLEPLYVRRRLQMGRNGVESAERSLLVLCAQLCRRCTGAQGRLCVYTAQGSSTCSWGSCGPV
jgi:hypothetical protein